jgi:DNA-binding beta-propeller fold protein YncE
MTRKGFGFGFGIALGLAGALGCAGEVAIARHAERQPPLVPKREAPQAQGEASPELVELLPVEKREKVPGFDGASAWLNVDHALSLEELAGRVVVVDFWTSCCINCLHTMPILERLERRFKDKPVVVVGVHSPKFDQEREADRLRDILRDNRIEHPVAVDAEMAIWRAWGVEAWPTVVVLDTSGRVIWAAMGEPDEEDLTRVVASALEESKGSLAKGELKGVRPEPESAGALRYPGKVLVLEDGGLAVADTGHNRIVLLDKAGAVTAVVGSGLAGRLDGALSEASFRRPQGMTEVGSDLYVADTGNHLIRKIDRKRGMVATVAGTGSIGYRRLTDAQALARDFALRSPWDVLHHKGVLYVALAGSHQIGVFDPGKGTVKGFVGSGHEGRQDGERWVSAFAQPSALATDGKELFVLDSETSSVRAVDFASGDVRTIVGKDLFVFGDVDGAREKVRLQHPIGMAFDGGSLWVADTYNSKLKRVNPATGETKTVIAAGLGEPAGVSARGGVLYVADTNHHRVVRAPAKGAAALEAVAVAGLSAPALSQESAGAEAGTPVASLGTWAVPAGKASRIQVRWQMPEGTAVNDGAPFKLVWTETHGLAKLPEPIRKKGAEVKEGFEVSIEPAPGSTSGALVGVLDVMICDVATHRVCVPVKRVVGAKFTVDPAADGKAPQVSIALPAAK